MSQQFSYKERMNNEKFQEHYIAYQEQYVEQIRESDRVLIDIIGRLVSEQFRQYQVNLLDIGCSTGNLLLHIKNAFPHFKLTGGDIAVKTIEECQKNPCLDGIDFQVNVDGYEDLNTYTVKTESGKRLQFRGTLFQPWCHLMAQKVN
ncbi:MULTISPECIES: class I SAM-dependent methyltransferase [Spirulina sp. CCY15215]|uniref:class I SAM-dependent methyltransferase n=1 Tax=Spirulina sp. CCY15215 TaxID=2767591 RepID=UPI00194FB2C6